MTITALSANGRDPNVPVDGSSLPGHGDPGGPRAIVGAAVELLVGSSDHGPGSSPVAQTYSEVRIDPETHEINLTVRNARSGEVLIAWPIRSLVQPPEAPLFMGGALLERRA